MKNLLRHIVTSQAEALKGRSDPVMGRVRNSRLERFPIRCAHCHAPARAFESHLGKLGRCSLG